MKKTTKSYNNTLRQVSLKRQKENGGKMDNGLNSLRKTAKSLQSSEFYESEEKQYIESNGLKRSKLRAQSLKRAKEMNEYYKLCEFLKLGCIGADMRYHSELPPHKIAPLSFGRFGEQPLLECHHIDGKENDRLLNPFNIICLTVDEHRDFTDEGKLAKEFPPQKLKDLVRAKRIRQGFNPADYGEELPQ